MWPWWAVEKWDAVKEVPGGRFPLVPLVGLAVPEVPEAPAVLEVLLEKSRREWSHPVLRHFRALPVLTDDRNRAPDPG